MIAKRSYERIHFHFSIWTFLLSEVDVSHIIFHFIFIESSNAIIICILFFNLSLLNYWFSIVDGLDDFESVLYFDIFLHHFPKQIVLHLSNNTFLLNYFQILHQLLLLGHILRVVGFSHLFQMFPLVLFKLVQILKFELQLQIFIIDRIYKVSVFFVLGYQI